MSQRLDEHGLPCGCPDPGSDVSKCVLGWKVWTADAEHGIRRFSGKGLAKGRTAFADLAAAWERLPDSIQVVMLYEDELATDGKTRYRRIMKGHDRYWVAPGVADAIYATSDDEASLITRNYPGAVIKEGRWIDTETYLALLNEAMADMEVP